MTKCTAAAQLWIELEYLKLSNETRMWVMLHQFSPALLTDSISIDIDPSFCLFLHLWPLQLCCSLGLLLEHAAGQSAVSACSILWVILSLAWQILGDLLRARTRGESWSQLDTPLCTQQTDSNLYYSPLKSTFPHVAGRGSFRDNSCSSSDNNYNNLPWKQFIFAYC